MQVGHHSMGEPNVREGTVVFQLGTETDFLELLDPQKNPKIIRIGKFTDEKYELQNETVEFGA